MYSMAAEAFCLPITVDWGIDLAEVRAFVLALALPLGLDFRGDIGSSML